MAKANRNHRNNRPVSERRPYEFSDWGSNQSDPWHGDDDPTDVPEGEAPEVSQVDHSAFPKGRLVNVTRVEQPEPMLVASDVTGFRVEISALLPRRIAVFAGPNEELLVRLVLPEEEGDALLISSRHQVEVSSNAAGGGKGA